MNGFKEEPKNKHIGLLQGIKEIKQHESSSFTLLIRKSVFYNGNTDIKPMTKICERTFNIDLGDFYHAHFRVAKQKNESYKIP